MEQEKQVKFFVVRHFSFRTEFICLFNLRLFLDGRYRIAVSYNEERKSRTLRRKNLKQRTGISREQTENKNDVFQNSLVPVLVASVFLILPSTSSERISENCRPGFLYGLKSLGKDARTMHFFLKRVCYQSAQSQK